MSRLVHRAQVTGNVFAQGMEQLKQGLSATRLGRTGPVRLTVAVVRELGDDDATHMAASVSYYAILSLFPLVMGLSAIVGMVAASPDQQETVIDFITQYLPGSESFVRDSVAGVVKFRAAFGVGSVLGLIWTGSAVFGAITRAVNRAWDVEKVPPFYKDKPRQLVMSLGVFVLFFFSLSMTTVFEWATTMDVGQWSLESLLGGRLFAVLFEIPATLVNFTVFAVAYKVLPNTETHWRDIWLGAIIAAVLFEAGKHLFLWYLDNYAGYDQVYGNIASVIVLMVWTYLSAFILILGAEIASEYERLKARAERPVEAAAHP